MTIPLPPIGGGGVAASAASGALLANPLGIGMLAGNVIGSIFAFEESKKSAQAIRDISKEMAPKYEQLSKKIEGLETYKISEEAREKLRLSQETTSDISSIGEEISDIAKKRASRPEMREASIERENIKNMSASKLEAIQESGGEGVLGKIVKLGSAEQQALRVLGKKQTAYRFQAESDLMNAKINQASLEATAGQLESAGLSGIIEEKGKVYQSELDKQLTGINLEIAKYSSQQNLELQSQQMGSQANAAFASGISNLALSYIQNRAMSKKLTPK